MRLNQLFFPFLGLSLGLGLYFFITKTQAQLDAQVHYDLYFLEKETWTQVLHLDLSRQSPCAWPAKLLQYTELQSFRCIGPCERPCTYLPKELCTWRNLQQLNLSAQALTTLPDSLFLLPKLKYADFSHNQISYLAPFASHTALETLDLSDNYLDSLPLNLFHCASLQHLNLANNRLASLPRILPKTNTLILLDLRGNGLCTLPDSLYAWEILEDLRLQRNQIHQLPEDFARLQKLRSLDLSQNELHDVRILAKLQNLRWLDLSNNPIPETDLRTLQQALPQTQILF